MDLGLTGKVAVVAGATAGLGLATARALAGEGAKVVLAGRRADVAQAEADKLPAAVGVGVDLTDPDGPRTLIDAAVAAFGQVDVLILNGGGPPFGSAEDVTPEGAAAAVELLLLPHIRLVTAVLPGMRERGWGRIIAIASTGVQQPIPGLGLSNVGRPALAGYLKTLSAEVAATGVTVNTVLPGRFDTDRAAALDEANAKKQGKDIEEVRATVRANIPVGRYGTTEEFAAVVTFTASAAASYVTGSQIRCDGGLIKSH